MHNVGFYYQVWVSNLRSVYENIKQLRKIYPQEKIFLTVAGLESKQKDIFLKDFGNRFASIFNISKIGFLFTDKIPLMPTTKWRCLQNNTSVRDGFNTFNNIWLKKLVETVDNDVDILVNCSDDWFIFEKVNFNLDQDISCRLTEWSDWMLKDKVIDFFKKDLNFVPWMQHGHYFNYKKFLKGYTESNINKVNSFVEQVYSENLPIFLDYFHALWNILIFDSYSDSNFISENKENPFILKNTVDVKSFHGYIGYRGKRFSSEMLRLGLKEIYE